MSLYRIKKYLKTEIESYEGKVKTNFHNEKMPKESCLYICLSVVLVDSVFKVGENYYPQVFLEKCKYII